MARSVNSVTLLGRLGRDADTKFTRTGVAISQFSVATERGWKDRDTGEWKSETDWTNVRLWRNEKLAPFLQKGKQVYVSGRLKTDDYEDKDGVRRFSTYVVAEEVILLGGGGRGDAQETRSEGEDSGPTDEDVPF